jgi:hypothetical protein
VKVTFHSFGDHLASSRYRALIPQRFFDKGSDVLVIGKHGWTWEAKTEGFARVVYDVCDDHYSDHLAPHYLRCTQRADLVTCNSEEMARIIQAQTGRKAIVIPDPYEQPERPARVHDKLLWFGHRSNLADLIPWLHQIPPCVVVSNTPLQGVTQWTPEAMDRAFDDAGLVVIPTGKSPAKSANRAIESLRRGLFPICGSLPAHADLGVWVGDIADGVRWALAHQDEALSRIKRAQAYIRDEYSPERIAGLWKKALETL